jgi:hypothetical protein
VQTVGERDVDGLDLRIGDDAFVPRDAAGDAVLRRPAGRAIAVAARDHERDTVAGLGLLG